MDSKLERELNVFLGALPKGTTYAALNFADASAAYVITVSGNFSEKANGGYADGESWVISASVYQIDKQLDGPKES